MNKVILYTTHCMLCEKLQGELNNKKIQYQIIEDIDTILKLGFTQMPMLNVNGVCMNFREAIEWVRGV